MNRITGPSNVSRCKLLRLAVKTKRLLTPIGVAALSRRRVRKVTRYALKHCSRWAIASPLSLTSIKRSGWRPDDVAANRRMLAWAEGARKSEAALNLTARERDIKVLREAIEALCAARAAAHRSRHSL